MRELIRALFKTSAGSAASLLFSAVALKIIAATLGPAGTGLFSLLRQIQQTALAASTAGGQVALVQGAASRRDENRSEYLATILCIFLLGGTSICLALVLFAPLVSARVMNRTDDEAVRLIRWLAVPIFLSVLSGFVIGTLNAYRALGRLAVTQVTAAVGLAAIAYPVALLFQRGHQPALILLLGVSAFASTGLGIVFLSRSGWLAPIVAQLRHGLRSDAACQFFAVGGPTIAAMFAATGTQVVLRSAILHAMGLASVGLFDAAWTLSMTYVTLILASFSTYYLPTLSEARDADVRCALMQRTLRVSTLLMVPLVGTVIVLKPLLIDVLYSTEFRPSLNVVRWMLVGDYLKVTSWVLGMPMLAMADMRRFFWTEIAWNLEFLGLAWVSLHFLNSVGGIGFAFLFMYATCLVYMLYYARSRLDFTVDRSTVRTWLLGLVLIVLASWATWSDVRVSAGSVAAWICLVALFGWTAVCADERRKLLRMIGAHGPPGTGSFVGLSMPKNVPVPLPPEENEVLL